MSDQEKESTPSGEDPSTILREAAGSGASEGDRGTDPRSRKKSLEDVKPLDASSPLEVIESMLKSPESLIARVHRGGFATIMISLGAVMILDYLVYGAIVGSFSGGIQWWAAPTKILLGSVFGALICLPSLFIFACLSGANIRLGQISAMLLACVTLTSVLLLGFAPIAWVFSQSTDAVSFMGFLHLVFWLIAVTFGMRILCKAVNLMSGKIMGFIGFWCIIYMITMLQVMTVVRPTIGPGDADNPLPGLVDKKFFMAHWYDTIRDDTDD